MIDLKNIVKTSFIPWLKNIITILLLIIFMLFITIAVGAGFALLQLFILLDEFLTTKLNFSFLYSIGLFAFSYCFFYFILKLFIIKIVNFWR